MSTHVHRGHDVNSRRSRQQTVHTQSPFVWTYNPVRGQEGCGGEVVGGSDVGGSKTDGGVLGHPVAPKAR